MDINDIDDLNILAKELEDENTSVEVIYDDLKINVYKYFSVPVYHIKIDYKISL
jgi:hypothetical protein